MIPGFFRAVVFSVLILSAVPTASAEPVRFGLAASAGTEFLWAGETVWSGSFRVSQLDWQSLWTATASASAEAVFPDGAFFRLSGGLGTAGDGHMVDTDWLASGTSDWSDRSVSPDTRIDSLWYFGLATGSPFAEVRAGPWTAVFSAGVWAEVRQVRWTSYGGSYVYTRAPGWVFRGTTGSFASGVKTISYRQTIPLGAVRLGTDLKAPGWSVGLAGSAGLCFGIEDVDQHWLRDLQFTDQMAAAPAASAELRATVGLGPGWELTFQSRYLQVFAARGSTSTLTMSSGADRGTVLDVAGADFRSVTAAFGFRTEL